MKSLYPQLRLTDPSFNYIHSYKTDIKETFRRFATSNQESKEPLVANGYKSLDKPLVSPTLNPGGFVLPAEWFEILG
ncbi:hypothetical protein UFOVP146_59 [uncultured Caudovirales phage]|uniref:Uncharacterized protein n=1 Tax=uncultured Caudovirales phage TaxID=2100421 RepID=A0A6J7VKG0_9CAUD|nr:hypothetical protein UFOVP146_59 [uncultured Caudovirales phage]